MFESSSTKVGARNGIYVWTPKKWEFLQTPRGRIFSYSGYFEPKGFIMVGVACGRPREAM